MMAGNILHIQITLKKNVFKVFVPVADLGFEKGGFPLGGQSLPGRRFYQFVTMCAAEVDNDNEL